MKGREPSKRGWVRTTTEDAEDAEDDEDDAEDDDAAEGRRWIERRDELG